MHKVYDFVGWHYLRASLRHIKMCDRFVEFFGGIYEDRVNRVMTDFGLSNDYRVHNGLDQIKRHEHLCGYCIDTKFVAKTSKIENSGEMSSFFAAGAFVDDMIWVGDCQFSMQYALNIVNDFFSINDISINNEKTVAIPINQDVRFASLSISGQLISIAKKDKAYRYLDIFLSTERLSKPSLAKAHSDVRFFVHTVLKKAITNKQFSYLVLAVLQPIVSYRTQFNILVKKGFKSKTHLPHNFSNAALYHPFLYGLKFFEQMQFEAKVASLIFFSNASGILGHLFEHRCLDLQVQRWASLNSLQAPVKLHVSPVNNFLAGVVKIFLDNSLSLVNNLPNAFRHPGHFLMSLILGESLYFDFVRSLKCYSVAFEDQIFDKKGLDLWGPVSLWFVAASKYLLDKGFFSSGSSGTAHSCGLNILEFDVFSFVWDSLHEVWSNRFEVYMDESLMSAGSANVLSDATVYFPALDLSIGIRVRGLLSSTMVELQAIALALECVLSFCLVLLFLDSQAAIDACVSELSSEIPVFHNCCWVKHRHVFNLIRDKDLSVSWAKVRGHAGVPDNVKANRFADKTADSSYVLPVRIRKHFLVAKDTVVLGNACHFIRDLFKSVCHVRWKAGLGCNVVSVDILGDFDWIATIRVWHPDSHMLAGLPVAVRKKLYDRYYPGVQCLLCEEVKLPDHVFSCLQDAYTRKEILLKASAHWVLNSCLLDIDKYLVLCKEFVMKSWCTEVAGVFNDVKKASCVVVDFVRFLVKLYCSRVWLVRSKFRSDMERAGLVGDSSLVSGLLRDMFFVLSDSVVRLLSIAESFAIGFGCHKPCLFFGSLDDSSCIHVSA
ncbi:hypothetical protein G9A89_011767 [Geosiphon pyriformis]|nr:hypothetical protein G9A89_011767 [Geosiphon pyriformis]